ncbi:MAG: hypothetical protein IJ557_08040 [Bacteroidaceae bacterium]|nr:hypothetical protein [Bacteroidaceae bacterium]
MAPEIHLTQNKSFFTRFIELSKGKQIVIIVYGIWFLGWLPCLIDKGVHFLSIFFLFAIVFPFIIGGVWYIYKICRKNKPVKSTQINNVNNSSSFNLNQAKITNIDTDLQRGKDKIMENAQSIEIETSLKTDVISSVPLLLYARSNGKMQVVNKKLSDGNYDHYCQFTSEDGKITRVDFSERTDGLNSKEISTRKYQLSVTKLADGKYCLDFLDDKQI